MDSSIKLARYLDKNNISDSEFGRKISRTPAMVGRYKRGLSIPSYHTALLICAETGMFMNEWSY